ncbi:yl1 nuclear protein domain-containing protein [Cyclospora cayetanensis]|uniref:Yl1 nuclear protein domain-containing protein n=1 Tax=Cyclospora cayetanensis TaxID=88456 RepID=A0A1D3D1V8_9EIME|nr:yl1 nuclear protein domain-containing protein [Cyclospora cayetanensis]
MSQEEHLLLADKTEKETAEALTVQQQHRELRQLHKEWKGAPYKGPYEMLVSWASYLQEEDYEKVLLIFTDGRLPAVYEAVPPTGFTLCLPWLHVLLNAFCAAHLLVMLFFSVPPKSRCALTGLPARYFDPLTRCFYSSAAAFKALRTAFHRMREREVYRQLVDLDHAIKTQEEKIIYLHKAAARAPTKSWEMIQVTQGPPSSSTRGGAPSGAPYKKRRRGKGAS